MMIILMMILMKTMMSMTMMIINILYTTSVYNFQKKEEKSYPFLNRLGIVMLTRSPFLVQRKLD